VKHWFKVISGLFVSLVVIGAVTMLAIRYFDVLVRGFETLRDKVADKKAQLFGCCDCDYDEDDLEDMEEA
jgi:hypothetical protein